MFYDIYEREELTSLDRFLIDLLEQCYDEAAEL